MRGIADVVGGTLWLLSGAFAGAAWGWAGVRILHRVFDDASGEAALAGGVIFGFVVALTLWRLGWSDQQP